MRIAIDARLNAYRSGGIPQYTRHLLTALTQIARDDHFICLQHRDMVRPLAVASNVSRRTVFTPPHHRLEQWALPLELALVRPNVAHFPDFIAPMHRSCPAVVTIHDLAFMHYPNILDDAARAYYGQVKKSAERADAIIAVSEATRQDISQFLDIPIEQVRVVYEAVAPIFRKTELRVGEARVLNGIPVAAGSFMLFVSTLEPRKNLPTLLTALRICLDRRPDRPYMLIIVGGRGWRDDAIFTAVRELRLAEHVLFAGSVGQYDLRWLYNACQFYINPSLYEGFGLPLLEAMACGAACLAAATSSLPEIGGDAAIYIPPLDPGFWADAIEELWDNSEHQQELGRIGRARAQRFSWTRAARETLAVYQRAVENADSPLTSTWSVQSVTNPSEPHAEMVGDLTWPTPLDLRSSRPCLRCATSLLPGELQRDTTIWLSSEIIEKKAFVPRAWVCPNCGYIEMVTEPVEAVDQVGQSTIEAVPDIPAVSDQMVLEPEPNKASEKQTPEHSIVPTPSAETPSIPAEMPAPEPSEPSEPLVLVEPTIEEQISEPSVVPAPITETPSTPDEMREPTSSEPSEPPTDEPNIGAPLAYEGSYTPEVVETLSEPDTTSTFPEPEAREHVTPRLAEHDITSGHQEASQPDQRETESRDIPSVPDDQTLIHKPMETTSGIDESPSPSKQGSQPRDLIRAHYQKNHHVTGESAKSANGVKSPSDIPADHGKTHIDSHPSRRRQSRARRKRS